MEIGHRKPKGNPLIFASSASNKSHHQTSSFLLGLLEDFLCNITRTPCLLQQDGHRSRSTLPSWTSKCVATMLFSHPHLPIMPTRHCFISYQSIKPWWPPVVGLEPSSPLFLSSQSLLPSVIFHYHRQEQLDAGFTQRHSQGTHPLELQPSHGATRHPLVIRRLGCCTVLINCSPNIWPASWNASPCLCLLSQTNSCWLHLL